MKHFLYSLFLILGIVIPIEVYGYHTINDTIDYVNAGDAVLLCDYSNENINRSVRIYYHHQKTAQNALDYGVWDIFYKTGSTWKDFSYGSAVNVFYVNDALHYRTIKGKYSDFSNFICPSYASIDTNAFDEICLDDDKDCGDTFTTSFTSYQSLNFSSDSIFNKINNYVKNEVFSTITLDDLKKNSSIEIIVQNKTMDYVKSNYIDESKYVFPVFLTNYISNLDQHIKQSDIKNYDKFQENINNKIDEAVISGEISNETGTAYKNEVSKGYGNYGSTGTPIIGTTEENSCQALLTIEFATVLNNIMTFIQYLGPILVILLSIIDFVKAAISGEQDAMKKATKNFYRRLIAAVLLFFVPLIVNLILGFTDIIPPQNCLG